MLVEIVSDLVCPWCYIGKRQFEGAIETLRTHGLTADITVHMRSFQLDPTAPIDLPRPVHELYAQRFGGPDRAARILRHVTEAAANVGINFDMDRALRANTRRAHRLLKHVQSTSPNLQMEVNESIMRAYFVEGRDINDVSTLLNCARRAGFDDEPLAPLLADQVPDHALDQAVEGDLRWAAERGITSVPTFVINGTLDIPGAQDSATLVRLLRRLVDVR